MIRNDYRRSLILLRSNASGYAGHVRLERRTLMGSMYFVVQAPEDAQELQAVLIGRDKTGYYACTLGMLRRDTQKQYCLSAGFDPRNICSRELEQYQLAAVLHRNGSDCRIVLFGNLNGHADIDWERATQAACALFEEVPEADMLARELPEPAVSEPIPEEVVPETAAEEAAPEPVREETQQPRRTDIAGGRLGIDMSLPWPESIENLRALFAESPVLENAPDAEHIYISAPMPELSGYGSCAIGLRMENGAIAAVSYALPSLYSPEPPAGLEAYSWMGDGNRGWWVLEIDV